MKSPNFLVRGQGIGIWEFQTAVEVAEFTKRKPPEHYATFAKVNCATELYALRCLAVAAKSVSDAEGEEARSAAMDNLDTCLAGLAKIREQS